MSSTKKYDKIGSRRIRVFLSSTFQDMSAEREYLVDHIFPAIKHIAEQRNVDFSIVDLRWGITEEEARQGKVIEICLNEINETQPFFIGLVGNRYGWCPTMEDIQKNPRLINLYPGINQYIEQGLSMTEIEMQYGVFAATRGMYAYFFLKDSSSLQYSSISNDEQAKLNNLRHKIISMANEGECDMHYYSSIEQLGDSVYNSLFALIEELYPEDSTDDTYILVERQRYLLGQLQNNYENSAACEVLNRAIFQFVVQMHAERYCIAITTKDNCVGKSALTANWGIRDSKNIIRTILNKDDDNAETALQHLRAEIQLRGLTRADHITWILDGLDYLHDEYERSLEWLMSDELRNIQLIVTANDKTILNNAKALCTNDDRIGAVIYIGEIIKSDAQTIVVTYLKQFSKGLSEQQINKIIQHKLFSQNVLLLKLFLNEMIQFGSYEKLDDFIQTYLNASTESQLIETILLRLEKDYGRETISSYFGLLSLTECGIPDLDLQRIMGISPINWSALRSATSLFMDNLQSLVILNHRLRKYIKERYNDDPTIENERHCTLLNLYNDLILNLIETDQLETNHKRYDQYSKEMVRQKIAIDGIENTFEKESYDLWITTLNDSEILTAFINYINGSAERLHECLPDDIFSTYPAKHLVDTFYLWLSGNANSFVDFVELTMERKLPDEIQRKWDMECQLFLDHLLKQYGQDPEDVWLTTPIDQLNLADFVVFEDQLILITDDMRISHIDENLDILIQRIKGIKTTYARDILAQLYILKCYCCYRNKDINSMETLYAASVHLNPRGHRKYSMLTFLIYLARNLDIECNHIILQVRQHADSQIDNNIRRKALGSLYTMQLLLAAHNKDEDLAMELIENIQHLWLDDTFQAYIVETWAAVLLQINKDYLYAGELYAKAGVIAPNEDAQKLCQARVLMCINFLANPGGTNN